MSTDLMGIYSRDYLRNDDGGSHRFGGRVSGDIVKTLIIANIIVFALQILTTRTVAYQTPAGVFQVRESLVQNWFELDRARVLQGQIWRLVTYAFCHDVSQIFHILFNMYILWLAGRRVQDRLGSREFLWFYMTAALLAGVVTILFDGLVGSRHVVLGASGAVAGVIIVYALTWPNDVWYIFGLIPMRVIWIAGVAAILDLYPMLQQLAGNPSRDRVAHATHIGGMLFGYFYIRNGWHLASLTGRFDPASIGRFFRRKPNLRVYEPEAPPPPDLDRRVDELLQKVQDQGEQSLTQKEREILMEASRRYRDRK
ncbi:MAG: rhomboid family intramembrane serine protease [Maioricimonas sp. JB049]